MGLEVATYLDDLNTANPASADPKSEGDDHFRLVKTVLKNTFPGLTGRSWRTQTKAVGYTVVTSDNMSLVNCTTALTLTLTAAATLGNGHLFLVHANGGAVIIDPAGAELINGGATLTVPNGDAAVVACDGASFRCYALMLPAKLSGTNTGDQASIVGITGTIAQFNAALSDGDFATIAGSETLTNKTLTTPTVSNPTVTTGSFTSPTLVTPALGTPASGVLTNCTGLPQAGLASAAVGQAQLKTTTGDMTTTLNISLQTGPGGEYGFWPTVKEAVSNTGPRLLAPLAVRSAAPADASLTIDTTLLNRFALGTDAGTSTLTARQRYVQASPPYNLGDGDVPLFIFALVDSLGKVLSTWTAPDPPWANNGPTNIRPDFMDGQGRLWQRRDQRKAKLDLLHIKLVRDDPEQEVLALIREIEQLPESSELIEITQAVKQADMPLIPHPFGGDLTGKTVVLLDPPATEKFLIYHQGGLVTELLYKGYLRVGNTPLIRFSPPGVMAVVVNWKLT